MLVISDFDFTSVQIEIRCKGVMTNVADCCRLEFGLFVCSEVRRLLIATSVQEITNVLDVVFQLIEKMLGGTLTPVQTKSGEVFVVTFVLTDRSVVVMNVVSVRVRR